MPEPYTLTINDIFWSIQGEGQKTGVPTIFLRLSGCSLRCSYCDTRESWDEGISMNLTEILAEVRSLEKEYPVSQIVITGGEPFEQDIGRLTQVLKKDKRYLAVETSGLYYRDLPLDWWTVSPKDKKDYFISTDLVPRISEVKLIVNENLTLDVVKRIRRLAQDFIIFLQPEYGSKNSYENAFLFYKKCIGKGIRNIRLGLQMHKIFQIK